MVTRRIRPMMLDGKKIYQIGIPIHFGYRGIQEDAGKTSRMLTNSLSPTVTDPNAYTPEFKAFWSSWRRPDGERSSGNQGDLGPRRHSAGRDTSRDYTVAKLIDVTTCIGVSLRSSLSRMEWVSVPGDLFR